MNKLEFDTLRLLRDLTPSNQRQMSSRLQVSLGLINKIIQNLKLQHLITDEYKLTSAGISLLDESKPRNAIILAAGYGLRMVPINQTKPKALLSIAGKPLIERLIEQLHEVGVKDIVIVVGYLKEMFEYLIDKYGVTLIYNKHYSEKNNLYSLACATAFIGNSYICPCDLYCRVNPFNQYELPSWYLVNDSLKSESYMHVSSMQEIKYNKKKNIGNIPIGIAFISKQDSELLVSAIKKCCMDVKYKDSFWEDALFSSGIFVNAKIVGVNDIIEINSYEDLRDLDSYSEELKNESISVICGTLNCRIEDIHYISTLKKGMTNRSYTFMVNDNKYIMRIPGEGTSDLIDRKNEQIVYSTIKGKNICDDLIYINAKNGMKISRFIQNARCCDPYSVNDLKQCMSKLRDFHSMKIQVKHEFDIFSKINFYESLWNDAPMFYDYELTKKNCLSLKPFIESLKSEWCLTHIDAVPDNFLFYADANTKKIKVQLIDWEYAAMQDPHVDIAMFCIYALYDEKKYIDRLINIYFENSCQPIIRTKIYCYISICGLLWSNWCQYKQQLGVEFGEYSLKQYRYAKEYYKIAKKEIELLSHSQLV